jgi:hypothetical protein
MAVPALTPQQRQAALAKAAHARQVRAEVKQKLRDRKTSLADVLELAKSDEFVAKLRVTDLLLAMPGVGQVKAHEMMERLNIAPSRRLRGLGAHQIAALTAEFAERAERSARG